MFKIFSKFRFLAVHNSSIGDLVTNSLTDSVRTLLIDIQRVTFETFDQNDEET